MVHKLYGSSRERAIEIGVEKNRQLLGHYPLIFAAIYNVNNRRSIGTQMHNVSRSGRRKVWLIVITSEVLIRDNPLFTTMQQNSKILYSPTGAFLLLFGTSSWMLVQLVITTRKTLPATNVIWLRTSYFYLLPHFSLHPSIEIVCF